MIILSENNTIQLYVDSQMREMRSLRVYSWERGKRWRNRLECVISSLTLILLARFQTHLVITARRPPARHSPIFHKAHFWVHCLTFPSSCSQYGSVIMLLDLLHTMQNLSRPRWSRGNVIASRSEVRGFKPDWGRSIFSGRKNPEHKSSRRDLSWGSWVWDFRLVKEPQAWINRSLSKI